ncbi:MAG: hypothetical protein IMW91_04145 [Firmicutes bacterium]|nr:hypothetical protein [Bacillota bacterium]
MVPRRIPRTKALLNAVRYESMRHLAEQACQRRTEDVIDAVARLAEQVEIA